MMSSISRSTAWLFTTRNENPEEHGAATLILNCRLHGRRRMTGTSPFWALANEPPTACVTTSQSRFGYTKLVRVSY